VVVVRRRRRRSSILKVTRAESFLRGLFNYYGSNFERGN
jgi:hypothetical protein